MLLGLFGALAQEPPSEPPVAEEAPAEPVRLTVAVKPSPPFAIKAPDGSWEGVSVELWRRVADQLDYEYEFEERDLKGMLRGLEDGSVDAAVAALTVTADREARFDFSHPFYTSGLGIAVVPSRSAGVLNFVKSVLSMGFLKALAALAGVLLFTGFLVWVFERNRNAEEFGGDTVLHGLAESFWWSAVTMTTVGYGDKAPKTLGGRLVALVWMFASIIMISSFTAAIASSLTLQQLDVPVSGPDELGKVKVGTVEASTSARWLEAEHLKHRGFSSLEEALEALVAGEVEAVVYDEPVLRYVAQRAHGDDVQVLDATFERQDYAIGLNQHSPHRESVNRVILRQIETAWWDDLVFEYVGK